MAPGPRKHLKERERGPLGSRVRALRMAKDVTQVELAAEIGVSRAHIAKMETGGDPPGREVLHALARFFNVSMDYLQTGRTDAPKKGRFVDNVEELAWLDLWHSIPAAERPRVMRMLRAAALDASR